MRKRKLFFFCREILGRKDSDYIGTISWFRKCVKKQKPFPMELKRLHEKNTMLT